MKGGLDVDAEMRGRLDLAKSHTSGRTTFQGADHSPVLRNDRRREEWRWNTAERRPNLHLTSPAVGFKWDSKRVFSKIGVSRQSKLAALLPKLMLR